VIAGKAICAEEALTDDYKNYIHQVVKNAAAMAEEFTKMGYDVVTGGTDNHMFLLDFSKTHPNITGKAVQEACDSHGITLNKNCVPNEQRSPVQTSGVRIGTPAMTTKGYKEEDFIRVAHDVDKIIKESQQ
jgi:glycine hydroxymethyltransferase